MRKRTLTAIAMATGLSAIVGVSSPACATDISESDIKNLQQLVIRQQQQLDSQAEQIKALNDKLNSVLGKTEENTASIDTKADKKDFENLKTDTMVV